MFPRAQVARIDYPTNDTCATVHVRHATTDRSTRVLSTRRHARPRVHLADRRITNLRARRSLHYSTCARPLHVGTPAHVCTVYGRPVNNLRARAGRYTTDPLPSLSLRPRSVLPLNHTASFRTFPLIARYGGTGTPPRGRPRLLALTHCPTRRGRPKSWTPLSHTVTNDPRVSPEIYTGLCLLFTMLGGIHETGLGTMTVHGNVVEATEALIYCPLADVPLFRRTGGVSCEVHQRGATSQAAPSRGLKGLNAHQGTVLALPSCWKATGAKATSLGYSTVC